MSENPDKSNTRSAVRLQHELLVAYKTVDGFITDWAVNISRGGIFINTPKPLAVGTVVKLIISLPDMVGTVPFDLTGRVARVTETDNPRSQVPGMGIEFIDVDDEKRDRIERFVERLRKELPDEATLPPGRTVEIKKKA